MLSRPPEESKLRHGNQRPKIEIAQAFMPVLITSNFDGDSIKNEHAGIEAPFFTIKMKSLSSAQDFLRIWDTKSR